MATNPYFGTNTNPNRQTNPENSLTNPQKTYTQGRNTFNFSRRHFTSARYADITPFEAINCEPGDIHELGSVHKIRSQTLSSVLSSEVFMKRTYMMCDMKAILPNNWDKIYQEPTFGDDISPSFANTYVDMFYGYFESMRQSLCDFLEGADTDEYLDIAFHYLMIFEHVFSNGSPLALLGNHASAMVSFSSNSLFDFDNSISFDRAIELLYSELSQNTFDLIFDNGSSYYLDLKNLSLRNVLNIIRYHHDFQISFNSGHNDLAELISFFFNFFDSMEIMHDVDSETDEPIFSPLNYERLAAYQICCVNFFSRDSVDDIITAKLYREAMQGLLTRNANTGLVLNQDYFKGLQFEWNGNYYNYDALSGYNFSIVLSKLVQALSDYNVETSDIFGEDNYFPFYVYFMNLFGYQLNLRYGDYFTGSKQRPLSVGDVTADVNQNSVNAIDMTVAILRARFGNAVNRAGRRPDDYLEEVMDGTPTPESDEPRYLVSINSNVSGFEVENTSNKQGDIVTLLRSSDSRDVYSVSVGSPAIIIGVVTFEAERVYSKTVDRFFLNRDRYDMFNKFLQFSGDQAILNVERDASSQSDLEGPAFGFGVHDIHQKLRYPIATGAFVDFLPSYLFVSDNNDVNLDDDRFYKHINPYYVRSKNSEFDRFYKSLINYSLAGYYHFFIEFNNICISHRKMAAKPSIL